MRSPSSCPPAPRAWRLGLLGVFVLFAGALGGCRDTTESALGVTVRVASGVKAGCVRVWVRPASGAEQVTEPIAIEGRSELAVAVYPSETLGGEVQLGARGYLLDASGGCGGTPVLNEESAAVNAAFVAGSVERAVVELQGVPSAYDEDGDGFRGAMFGGADCNDGDGTVHPDAVELCGDGRDNDCNGLGDCADASCEAKSCSESAACTDGAVCIAGACTGGGPTVCTQTANPCREQTGTCDAAKGGCQYAPRPGIACGQSGLCTADGECLPAGAEANCANGVDDNGVDGTDCADASCLNRECDPQDLCHPTARCAANGTCDKGPRKVCNEPPSECHATNGTCQSGDGNCHYPFRPAGSACSLGECLGTGQCVPSETGAQCGDGIDNDGDGNTDCEDVSCNAQACDPQNQCVIGKTCGGGQCGGGNPVMCNAPPTCFAAGNPPCQPATGCSYVPTPGAACPGGFCSATGVCGPPFPYVPSNFSPLDYPPAMRTGAMHFNCTQRSWINTDSGFTGTSRFDNWCANVPQPTLHVVQQSNGLEAIVIATESLTIASNSSLGFYGDRPVIFAVYGNATIDGLIFAGGTFASNGPGARFSLCTGSVGGAGGTSSTLHGGGGGGGFGTAGGAGGTSGSATIGGTPGAPPMNLDPTLKPLRGGCSGGYGGNADAMTGSGLFGGAGGAVQISAAGTLTINGTVWATGSGGAGGDAVGRGGGGGGSGGALLFEGNSAGFGSSAVISVAGGGGGEGGSTVINTDGADGQPATTFNPNAASALQGGSGGTSIGGNGGNGAWMSTAAQPGNPGSSGGGGGGGGGGLGIIRINSATSCALQSSASLRGVVSSTGTNCPCASAGAPAPTHGVCAAP